MDRSEVKAIVEAEIDPLMDRLGIPHWRITVCFGPIDADRTPCPSTSPAVRNQIFSGANCAISNALRTDIAFFLLPLPCSRI
jgi:hypothetical protein